MPDMLISCEQPCEKIDLNLIAAAAYKTLKQRVNLLVELCFCDEDEIRRVNNETRNIDAVTDVLSFPAAGVTAGEIVKKQNYPFDVDPETGRVFMGSIMICTKRAEQQASEYGHGVEREIAYLTVHGVMHLFGYDHMTDEDKAEMREMEEKTLEKAGIPRG